MTNVKVPEVLAWSCSHTEWMQAMQCKTCRHERLCVVYNSCIVINVIKQWRCNVTKAAKQLVSSSTWWHTGWICQYSTTHTHTHTPSHLPASITTALCVQFTMNTNQHARLFHARHQQLSLTTVKADWVKALRPTRHKIDVLPSQHSTEEMEPNTTKVKQHEQISLS